MKARLTLEDKILSWLDQIRGRSLVWGEEGHGREKRAGGVEEIVFR